MKKLFLIIPLFLCLTIISQTPSTYSVTQGVCIKKELSIVFYIVVDSLSDPGQANTATITAMVNKFNDVFDRICLKFKNCSTVYLHNYQYGTWKHGTTEPAVVNSYYTEKTMNIYLVDTVVSTPNEFNNDFGYCDSPTLPSTVTTRPDVIVMEKNRLPQNNWAYPLHILGHFFGLRHTDAQISPTVGVVPSNPNTLSQEYVDGSNCYVHGDGFCDTEADPGASGATHDAKGDLYLRPIDNLMSGYSTRCRFTLEQFNYMANSILTSRKYLH